MTEYLTWMDLAELPWKSLSERDRAYAFQGIEGPAKIAYTDSWIYVLFMQGDRLRLEIVTPEGELENYCFMDPELDWRIDVPIIPEKTAPAMEEKWTSLHLPFAHRVLEQSHGPRRKFLCFLPDNDATPWASWIVDDQRNCIWGHYYSDRTAAYQDYESR